MRTRTLLAALALCCATASSASGQWFNHPTPGIPRTPEGRPDLSAPAPRSADGRPDLSGLWRNTGNKYIVNVAADMRPEDVPFQPWAEALYRQRQSKDDPAVRCLPLGLPRFVNSTFRILQTPGIVAVLYEIHTLYRQIFTDGRPLPPDPNPTWFGYSVGRWEGDSFVADTTGFNDKTWLDVYGHPHTEALRVTERFRRRDFGHMDLQVTIDDPKAYTRPWTVTFELTLAADTDMIETVCENHYQILPRLVGTGPAHPPDRKAIDLPRQALSRYVGAYEVAPGRDMVVSLADDRLTMRFPGNPDALPMFPESATRFFMTVGDTEIEFLTRPDGRIAGLVARSAGIADRTAVRREQ